MHISKIHTLRIILVYQQAWVTVAIDDETYHESLVLAESLRRCMTNRKILVILGPAVSTRIRHNLEQVFDGVIKLGNDSNGSFEDVKAAARHKCWSLPAPYKKFVFLDPRLLVLLSLNTHFYIISIM